MSNLPSPYESNPWRSDGSQEPTPTQWHPTAHQKFGPPAAPGDWWQGRISDPQRLQDQFPVYQVHAPSHAVHSINVYAADNSDNTILAPVTSLITGLIGFFIAWIPIIGIVAWVFGPLAVIFGVLGLRRGKAENKIMSIIGIVAGAIALAWCFGYLTVFIAGAVRQ